MSYKHPFGFRSSILKHTSQPMYSEFRTCLNEILKGHGHDLAKLYFSVLLFIILKECYTNEQREFESKS